MPYDPLAAAAQLALTTTASSALTRQAPTGYLDIRGDHRGNLSLPQSKGPIDHWADNPDAFDQVILAGKPLLGLCRLKGKAYEQRLHRKRIAGVNGASVTFLALEPAEFHIEWEMWMPSHWQCYQELVPALKILKPLPTPPTPPDFSDVTGGSSSKISVVTTAPGIHATEQFNFDVDQLNKGLYAGLSAPTGAGVDPKAAQAAAEAKAKQQKHEQQFATPIFSIYHPFLAAIQVSLVHVIRFHIPEDKDGKGHYVARIECLEVPILKKSGVGKPRQMDPNALKTLTAKRTKKPSPPQTTAQTFNPPPSTTAASSPT